MAPEPQASPPPEKTWPERVTLVRCGECGEHLGIMDVTRIEHERLCTGPDAGLEYITYLLPQQQQGGVEEAVVEFEARAETEKKMGEMARAGNDPIGAAIHFASAECHREDADYLRKHFDLPAPQQGGEGS